MKKRSYIKYTTGDFILVGRVDSWNEDINKNNQIDEIIKTLLTKYDKKDTLDRIKNYLLGYKIGKLEYLLSKCEKNILFNFATREFTEKTANGINKTSFKDGYESLKKESIEEARQILKLS